MVSSIIKFTAVFLSSLSMHALCVHVASQTTDNIKNRAIAEYHLHECGRAIAAIQNFKVLAKSLESSPQSPGSTISDTIILIQNALTDAYGEFYKIEESFCIDRNTMRPMVATYRRGPDNQHNSLNFSYRFL